jgi:hypothetical protein
VGPFKNPRGRSAGDSTSLKEQLKIWQDNYDKHPPSKKQKATKRDAAEDSDHKLPNFAWCCLILKRKMMLVGATGVLAMATLTRAITG